MKFKLGFIQMDFHLSFFSCLRLKPQLCSFLFFLFLFFFFRSFFTFFNFQFYTNVTQSSKFEILLLILFNKSLRLYHSLFSDINWRAKYISALNAYQMVRLITSYSSWWILDLVTKIEKIYMNHLVIFNSFSLLQQHFGQLILQPSLGLPSL